MATSGTAYGNGVTIGSSVNNNYIFINWQLASQNANANTSYINWQAYFHYTSSDAQLDDGDVSVNGSLRWDVPGRVKNYTGTFTTRDHQLASEGSFAIGHNTDGSKTFNISGSIGGSLSARSSASTNFDLPGFDRTPTTPGITGGTRDQSGTRFSTTSWSGSVNSAGPGVTWYLQYSGDNVNFYDSGASTTTSSANLSMTGLGATTTYYFRIRATNIVSTKYSGSITVYGAPTAPGKPSPVRSTTTAGQVDISWPHSSSNLQLSQYDIYRDGVYLKSTTGNWAANSTSDTGLARGSSHTYTVYGYNSSGWSAISATSDPVIAPGVPSAPGVPTVSSKVGRTLTINSARGSSDYGNAISEYRIQLSTDNGLTWKGWNNTTKAFTASGTYNTLDASGNFTYSLLTPALTYKWRVYAINSIGSGDISVTESGTFVGAGGKRWTGSAWEPTATSKRWTGTQWEDFTIAKRWNGNNWED